VKGLPTKGTEGNLGTMMIYSTVYMHQNWLNLFKIGKNLFYVNDATIILIGKGGRIFLC
jgi:hypothetical protein